MIIMNEECNIECEECNHYDERTDDCIKGEERLSDNDLYAELVNDIELRYMNGVIDRYQRKEEQYKLDKKFKSYLDDIHPEYD
jgi:hypothetical protein